MPRLNPQPGLQVSQLARALSDRSRAVMLDVLMDGEAHTIGALARAARVTAATASSHLRTLGTAKLVTTANRGREKLVRIADPDVAEILERLTALAAPTARRELRFARTC